jgi:hypothetical protein
MYCSRYIFHIISRNENCQCFLSDPFCRELDKKLRPGTSELVFISCREYKTAEGRVGLTTIPPAVTNPTGLDYRV